MKRSHIDGLTVAVAILALAIVSVLGFGAGLAWIVHQHGPEIIGQMWEP